MYAAIRQYAPIVRVAEGSHRQIYFTLWPTDRIDELKRLAVLDCGTIETPIHWNHYDYEAPELIWPSLRPCLQPRPANGAANAAANGDQNAAAPNILHALNRHCICEIFELRVLSVQDLCTIALACADFNELATATFSRRFGTSAIRLGRSLPWSLSHIGSLFWNFGAHITSLHLDIEDARFVLFAFTAKYCPNVEQLLCSCVGGMAATIAGYGRLSRECRQKIAAPFAKLRKLELYLPCRAAEPRSRWDRAECRLPRVHLPALRHFHVQNATILDGSAGFFAANSELTVLRVRNTDVESGVESVLGPLTNLRVLVLIGVDWQVALRRNDFARRDDVQHFGHLRKLEKFKYRTPNGAAIYCGRRILAVMHSSNAPIKWLKLHTTEYPEIVEQMAAIEVAEFYDLSEGSVQRLNAYVESNPNLRMISDESHIEGNMVGFERKALAR